MDNSQVESRTSMYSNNQPRSLIQWAHKTKNLVVTEADTPIKNCELLDIKVKKRNEDEVFLTDDEVFQRIRRGNCVISYTFNNQRIFKMARKGLKKFFDYKINYKSNKEGKKMKKIVLDDVKKSFSQEKGIKVYLTEKANGENLQISYDDYHKAWIVASKNVTIVCRNIDDVNWYRFNAQNVDKYSYCIEFAELWLEIVEKKLIEKNKLQEFLTDIKDYTLVGENIGEMKHQHIKIYDRKDIIFYAMVKNDSDDICMPLSEAKKILKDKYDLSFVLMDISEIFKDYKDFINYMDCKYQEILLKDVETGGEGSVAYFTSAKYCDSSEEVISMGKLKTFEYRFLRKLREKLKSFNREPNPETILKKIKNECIELLGEEGDEVDLTEYLKFAEFVLKFVHKSNVKRDFTNLYGTFIYEMKLIYNSKNENKISEENTKNLENIKIFENSEKIIEKFENDIKICDDENSKSNNFSNEIKISNILSDLEIKENEDKIHNFKNHKIYFFLNIGLVAGGKSTFFSTLKNIIESQYSDRINLMEISSDKYRRVLVDKYMASHPKADFNEAHSKVENDYKDGWDKEILKTLRNKRVNDKINIIFIDKNFFHDKVQHFYDFICKKYEKKGKFQIIVFHPKIVNVIREEKLVYPFSWSYFIQTYHRLKLRKNHESLDFEKCAHAHYILLSFLSLFRGSSNFEIEQEDKIQTHSISFSDEKELCIPQDIKKSFKMIMNHIGKKPFKKDHIESLDKVIKIFFQRIEEEFPYEKFEDTRETIKNEVCDYLNSKIK